ncbi:hypothetical protein SELMODRAFT_92880, partial [Selaginella moellendorffii]
LQKGFYKCAANCFDTFKTVTNIQACIEDCSIPAQTAQNVIRSEVARFQERINKSIIHCKEKFEEERDSHRNTENQIAEKAQHCIESAVREHIIRIPSLTATIKSQIAKK